MVRGLSFVVRRSLFDVRCVLLAWLFAVCCLLFAVCCLLFVVYCVLLLCVVGSLLFLVR